MPLLVAELVTDAQCHEWYGRLMQLLCIIHRAGMSKLPVQQTQYLRKVLTLWSLGYCWQLAQRKDRREAWMPSWILYSRTTCGIRKLVLSSSSLRWSLCICTLHRSADSMPESCEFALMFPRLSPKMGVVGNTIFYAIAIHLFIYLSFFLSCLQIASMCLLTYLFSWNDALFGRCVNIYLCVIFPL